MFRTRTLEYAILAATEIAKADGKLVLRSTVAEKFNLPQGYAVRIMGDLAKARVLRSDRGPFGGYALARPAKQITLLEIYEAVMSRIHSDDWTDLPTSMRRPVNDAMDAVIEVIRERLGSATLADLLKG